MAGFTYAAALALALVFAVAAVAKLRRRAGTARAFAGLGLASPRVLALGVPVVELALAAGLVVVPGWAGIVALAVLAGFTAFVVQAIRRGDPQGCGCFGATRPAPMGPAELLRNGLLALGAVIAAFTPRPSPWTCWPWPLLSPLGRSLSLPSPVALAAGGRRASARDCPGAHRHRRCPASTTTGPRFTWWRSSLPAARVATSYGRRWWSCVGRA
jgi:uncharacterized membrane protein YphA (DoxX/SURF4 family)